MENLKFRETWRFEILRFWEAWEFQILKFREIWEFEVLGKFDGSRFWWNLIDLGGLRQIWMGQKL